MTLSFPCTYPVRPGGWTRLRRWIRLRTGRQTPMDVLPDVCGATAPNSASCGVCGCVVACCERHGGQLGMFQQMHVHLETHNAPAGAQKERDHD